MCGCQEEKEEHNDKVTSMTNLIESEEALVSEEPAAIEKQRVELIGATSFSEGIAWVKYLDDYGVGCVGWLDTSGKIFTPEVLMGIDWFGGEFSSGYTYINYKNGSFDILDKEGNITATSPEGEGYKILTGGDGVYLVRQEIRNIDVNEDRYGFIDVAGNWVYELSAEHPFVFEDEAYYPQVTFYYHGEHVFSVQYLRNDYSFWTYLYNVDTGALAIYKNEKLLTSYDGSAFEFHDGYAALYEESKHSVAIYSVAKDGKSLLITDEYGMIDPMYGEGLIFTGESNYSSKAHVSTIENGKFYKPDGTVAIDLSHYTLVYSGAEDLFQFKDGYAAIVILGADYKCYLTIIDRNGDIMFEPIKVGYYTSYYDDACGNYSDGTMAFRLVKNVDGNTKYVSAIIDNVGNIIELDETIDYGNVRFHDGYALLGEEDYYFMGKDGCILKTYIEKYEY